MTGSPGFSVDERPSCATVGFGHRHLDHREVGLGISAHDPRWQPSPVTEYRFQSGLRDVRGGSYDVVVGQQVAVAVNHHTGTKPTLIADPKF